MSEFTINTLILNELATNTYIISNKNNDAIIIDPSSNGEKIEKFIEDKNLNILAILLTHGHFDHIGAVDYLVEKFNIPFYIHPEDEYFLKRPEFNLSQFFGAPFIVESKPNLLLENNLEINSFTIKIIETPGHTRGSVCYIFNDKIMFSGDTIFNGTIGRTDLPTSNDKSMRKSLERLSKIQNKNLIVYPGHDSSFLLKDFNFQYFINYL